MQSKKYKDRWWFLTPGGFEEFSGNPAAMGYEILSRHSRFPLLTIATDVETKVVSVIWDHSHRLIKPAWIELSQEAQKAFLQQYRSTLKKMGLFPMKCAALRKGGAWVNLMASGKSGATGGTSMRFTFDCTCGEHSILRAFSHRIYGRFEPPNPPKSEVGLQTRTKRGWISFAPNTTNPDVVTVGFATTPRTHNPASLYAGLRTFLEHDQRYLDYRNLRLEQGQWRRGWFHSTLFTRQLPYVYWAHEQELEKHLSHRRHSFLPKQKAISGIIALACAARDCQQDGETADSEITTKHLEAIGRRNRFGDPKNHIRTLRKLQAGGGFGPKTGTRKPGFHF